MRGQISVSQLQASIQFERGDTSESMMTDIAIAREAAAKAQANDTVAAMIRSGKHDDWPNVQGALNAIRAVRAA